jgi:hypothetical protein
MPDTELEATIRRIAREELAAYEAEREARYRAVFPDPLDDEQDEA